MSIVFRSPLSDKQQGYLNSVLRRYSTCNTANDCRLWTGPKTRDGYGYVRFTFDGVRRRLAAHRLAYYLASGCQPLSVRQHVSHLCNVKGCINVSHLSLELATVNKKREICHRNGECTGHRGHALCKIQH
jgi:hypothetical protein